MNQAPQPGNRAPHKTYRLCVSYSIFSSGILNHFVLPVSTCELDTTSQSFHEIIFITEASVLRWFWISTIFYTSVAEDEQRLARMFQEQTSVFLYRLTSLINRGEPKVAILGFCLAAPFIFLLLWRLWTFTILPKLHPSEPRELPYWIPCEQSVRSPVINTDLFGPQRLR